jgi:replication factor C large subunit
MYSEAYRPSILDEVIGHTEAKEKLQMYLRSKKFEKSIFLTGSPGIGKTTLALAAARSCGFDPLEINASKAIRSFEDVERIRDSCMSAVVL